MLASPHCSQTAPPLTSGRSRVGEGGDTWDASETGAHGFIAHLSKLLVDDTKLEGVVQLVFIVCHDQLRSLQATAAASMDSSSPSPTYSWIRG